MYLEQLSIPCLLKSYILEVPKGRKTKGGWGGRGTFYIREINLLSVTKLPLFLSQLVTCLFFLTSAIAQPHESSFPLFTIVMWEPPASHRRAPHRLWHLHGPISHMDLVTQLGRDLVNRVRWGHLHGETS